MPTAKPVTKPTPPRNGHKLTTTRRLVNGVVRTAYSCPCGRFEQSGTEEGRNVPKATVAERFDRHLTLR